MARLIDADKYPCKKCGKTYCHQNCEMFWDWIRNTVDAVPVVHGRWEYYSTTMQECSNCHRHTARHKFKHCPHCGAVMEDKYNESTD